MGDRGLTRGRNYNTNVRTLFDENYALAATQNLKNKDIPEGGAKGTILPLVEANYKQCFQKYVDVSLASRRDGAHPWMEYWGTALTRCN